MSRKVVDAWFDAFRDRDVSALPLAENFVHVSPFGEIHGKRAYLEMVRENANTFFAHAIDIVDVIDGGDRFAVRYRVGGMPVCEFIYIEDGLIRRIEAYYHFGEKPVLPHLDRWYNQEGNND